MRVRRFLWYTWQDEIFLEPSNALEVQDSYTIWNARIAFKTLDEKWELAVWGKNLDDELYRFGSVAFPPFGQELVLWSPPRTYGATVTWWM